MNWVVQAPARNLRGDEKKLFARVRQTLYAHRPAGCVAVRLTAPEFYDPHGERLHG